MRPFLFILSPKVMYTLMIHIHGNLLGMLMFVASALVAGAGLLLLKLPDSITMIGVGLSLVAMDLGVRLRSRKTAGWLTQKALGGYLFLIPVWGVGIIVLVANIIQRVKPA